MPARRISSILAICAVCSAADCAQIAGLSGDYKLGIGGGSAATAGAAPGDQGGDSSSTVAGSGGLGVGGQKASAGDAAMAAGGRGGKPGNASGGSDTGNVGGVSTSGGAGASSGGNVTSSGAGGGGASSSSGSGGSAVTVADVFGVANQYGDKLLNSYILLPCYAKSASDCLTVPSTSVCPNQGTALAYADRGVQGVEYFDIGGIPGTAYLATLHVDGIVEAKYYQKGTCTGTDRPTTCDAGRAAGLSDPPAAATNAFQSCTAPDPAHCTDAFYTGGDPVNFEYYNVYQLTVFGYPNGANNAPGAEVQHYYLNSFPATASGFEGHTTYYVSYSHTIPVVGGGKIEYRTADPNCHTVDNCGPGSISADCTMSDKTVGRSIPNATVPQVYLGNQVSTTNLINGATQPFHAQILHITVTAITAM